MLFLMARLWPVVYYLFPGLLLGFGLAVLPHREQLGRGLPPARRWLLRSLPERALATGWLLMAATLLAHNLLEEPGLVLGACLVLDAVSMAGLALVVWRGAMVPCEG